MRDASGVNSRTIDRARVKESQGRVLGVFEEETLRESLGVRLVEHHIECHGRKTAGNFAVSEMLPFGFRVPMSKASSKISRCVASPCESTTIARSCSCFAPGEIDP